MAVTINRQLKELFAFVKKEKFPGETKLTFFDVLKNNFVEDGEWDGELVPILKEKVLNSINKLKKADLQNLWKDSSSSEDYDDPPEKEIILEDLSEELTNLILTEIEEVSPRQEFFIDTNKKEKFDNDDDELDIDFANDIFDDDDLDELDDDFFDDDRY